MGCWLLWGLALQIADDAILEDEKTKELIVYNFEKVFLPMDKTSRAQAALADLHMEGPPFWEDFHRFCSSFELEAGKSGIEDQNILKDMLRQAVSTDLAFKMTSLKNKPKMYKDWLTKAGQFYDVIQQFKKLQSGNHAYVPSGGYQFLSTSSSHHDPNAMDVDAIQLSPSQWVEHMKNNKCFICHKVGCQTNRHPHPGNKTTTHTPPTSPSSFTRAIVVFKSSSLLNYARKLNILEKEAVASLGIVYGELNQDGIPIESQFSEMVAFVAKDFWRGEQLQRLCLLPFQLCLYL